MTSLDRVCAEIVERTQGGIACMLIDAKTAQVLGRACDDPTSAFSSGEIEAVCALLCGQTAARLAELASEPIGFEELHIAAAGHALFAKLVGQRRAVLVVRTTKTASIGWAWAEIRARAPSIEAQLI